jgi:hypothetical protein
MAPVRRISLGLRINIAFWPRWFMESPNKRFKLIELYQPRELIDDCLQD